MKPQESIAGDGERLLLARGWRFDAKRAPWAWQQPRTKAWFRLRDAVDVERGTGKGGSENGKR